MTSNLLALLILVPCLFVSFLLSGMEAGVFALNRLRVRRLARAGRPSAIFLSRFLENPEKFLWTILVGNTLANFLILGFALAKLHEWFQPEDALILVLFTVLVFLFYSLFDLLPKMLFRAQPNALCLGTANIFRILFFALIPLVLVVEGISTIILRWTGGRAFTGQLFGNREEMRAFMQESGQSFTSDERVMINRVLDLQNFTVRQIAAPLDRMASVGKDTSLGEALALAREKKFSRLPVWEQRDGKRRISGLLSLGPLLYRDGLDSARPVSTYMAPALFLNENTRLDIALRLMQRAGHRLAIVLARNGVETGAVTLEDILKVLFGEVKL
ncbi:MAG TPA: CNNM domain-containing protein [Verrucomicrobiae bacterium]|jgi:CBS domain containing-hemolysin-like protein|nr:CNNM domain-containing protein [Verrucomicrobiae bacterium]